MSHSLAEQLAAMSPAEREAWTAALSEQDRAALRYKWRGFWARPEQLPPPDPWRFWLCLSGRGWGKTRVGAETVRWWVETGQATRIALVNDTAADVRDIQVDGPDGILAVCPPWDRPVYHAGTRRVIWPRRPNGLQPVAICYSAEAPGLLRGPQHDKAWCDELAKWQNLRKADSGGDTAWSNLLFGLRVGDNPQAVITTTPRPIKTLLDLLKRSGLALTRGTTADNRANLSDDWYRDITNQYAGTRLGRQELNGEVLEDTEGALWSLALIDRTRVPVAPTTLLRVVVAVDPPGSTNGAEAGIVVSALANDGHIYVLADRSLHGGPETWGARAVEAYDAFRADAVVAEINYGGEMVAAVVRGAAQAAHLRGVRPDSMINIRVVTATRGKALRAEPISSLYHQGRVHHVGSFAALEDQMSTWVVGMDSPDRMDAAVWGATDLLPMMAMVTPTAPIAVDGTSRWEGGLRAAVANPATLTLPDDGPKFDI